MTSMLVAGLVTAPCAAAEHAMSYREMAQQMQMDDRGSTGKLLVENLEWSRVEAVSQIGWDAQAWYGNDYHKIMLKTEGAHTSDATHARFELLWDRVLSRWWNLQLGARQDRHSVAGVVRNWVAAGVAGLVPGQIELEAAAYLGDQGRSALRFTAGRDLLITQRLILQPQFEANLYGRRDVRSRTGSGLADVELALRLRYEFRPQVALYGGAVWERLSGATAGFARAAGEDPDGLHWVLGVRLWL